VRRKTREQQGMAETAMSEPGRVRNPEAEGNYIGIGKD
jgi:hypothetical protein